MDRLPLRFPPSNPLMPARSYEILATTEKSKLLLKTTQDLNEKVYLIRQLRRQRSSNLTLSEKKWIDTTIQTSTKTVSDITSLAEPTPEGPQIEKRWLPTASILQRWRYRIKDSPEMQSQLAKMTVADAQLTSAMSILSSSLNSPNIVLTPSQTPTGKAPSAELSAWIHQRRSYSATSSLTTFHRPLNLTTPPASPHSSAAASSARSDGPAPSTEPMRKSASPVEAPTSETNNPEPPWVRTLSQKRLEECMIDQEAEMSLTLVIETMENWRQTTEEALGNTNPLEVALSSGIMDRSISSRLCRSKRSRATTQDSESSSRDSFVQPSSPVSDTPQPQKKKTGPTVRRKPVGGRDISITGLSAPIAEMDIGLRNSFDKEIIETFRASPQASTTPNVKRAVSHSGSDKEVVSETISNTRSSRPVGTTRSLAVEETGRLEVIPDNQVAGDNNIMPLSISTASTVPKATPASPAKSVSTTKSRASRGSFTSEPDTTRNIPPSLLPSPYQNPLMRVATNLSRSYSHISTQASRPSSITAPPPIHHSPTQTSPNTSRSSGPVVKPPPLPSKPTEYQSPKPPTSPTTKAPPLNPAGSPKTSLPDQSCPKDIPMPDSPPTQSPEHDQTPTFRHQPASLPNQPNNPSTPPNANPDPATQTGVATCIQPTTATIISISAPKSPPKSPPTSLQTPLQPPTSFLSAQNPPVPAPTDPNPNADSTPAPTETVTTNRTYRVSRGRFLLEQMAGI